MTRHIFTSSTICHRSRSLPAIGTFRLSERGQIRQENYAARLPDHSQRDIATEKIIRKTA